MDSSAVVLITGASRGIGAATAEAFDRIGVRVALAARGRDGLERVAERLRDALVIPTDLSRADEARAMVQRTVDHFGRVDVLINNASTLCFMRSDSMRAEDVRAAMETNFIGPMVATLEAVRAMRRQGRGQIINIGSPGYLLGLPMTAPYTASKAALSGWTRAMQAEWDGTEIQVTEFFPGYVDTGLRAESELGDFGDYLAADSEDGGLLRLLVRRQSTHEIARQLVDCARHPRATVYSSPSVRLAAFLGLFSRLRVHLGSRMARAMRARTGVSIFTPASRSLPGETASAAREDAVASFPSAEGKVGAPAATKRDKAVKAKTVKRKAAKMPAVDAVAKTTPAATAGSAGANKKVTGKRAANKTAMLSPEATARVRAAVERAAASAKGPAVGGAPSGAAAAAEPTVEPPAVNAGDESSDS